MAATVDAILQTRYSDNILLQVQQLTSRIVPTVFQKPDCQGAIEYQDQIATHEASEKTSRNQKIENIDPTYDHRKIIPRFFYVAPLIDTMDKLMMCKDPSSEVVQSNAGALARKQETVLCVAFRANAYSGTAGTTANSLPTGQIIVHSSAGLNMVKIRAAHQILDENEVPVENRHLAMTAEQVGNLLAITEVTSSDYAQVKALVSGQPGTLCGFSIVRSERLEKSSTTRYCMAYHKTGMVLGTWLDLNTRIDRRPDLVGSPWQLNAEQSYGATRLEEKKVVQIECTEIA